MSTDPTKLTLAVFDDFREENWPSMDLVAEMLLDQFRRAELSSLVSARSVCPKYRRRFGRFLRNADRLLNRFVDYPKRARKIRDQFDCFHICDHSYAHLALELPADRTSVFCHDLDAFRCLIEPARDPRPKWFRAMARRSLRGMQRAAIVFYTTHSVRDEITQHQLVDPKRLVQAPLGLAEEFTSAIPESREDFILHVGSCVARKRVDVLLDAIAQGGYRLVQVGGTWTAAQRTQIDHLRLSDRITQLPRQSRAELANLYRRAKALLVTSEAEGFGLPVIEALACGAPVIASDIPSLRETGDDAAIYCKTGDAHAFARAIVSAEFPSREKRLAHAAKFSWENHARIILTAYRSMVDG